MAVRAKDGELATWDFTMYEVSGKPLQTLRCQFSDTNHPYTPVCQMFRRWSYFAGRLTAGEDRLGSVGTYWPYGEERTQGQGEGAAFGTYWRDWPGQDYADQRYYSANAGRFWTPDPGNAGDLSNPTSLNLYAYVLDDPINSQDPEGLCTVMIGGITQIPYTPDVTAQQDVAESIGAISAFPYNSGSKAIDITNILAQGVGVPTGAVATALQAIALAAQNSGPIDIIAFSGGAAAFTSAWNYLSPDVQSRIQSITYVAPGSSPAQSLTSGTPGTTIDVYEDSTDFANTALQLVGGSRPSSQNYTNTGNCGHNANCIFANYLDQITTGKSSCQIGAGGVFGAPPPKASSQGYNNPFGSFMMTFYWGMVGGPAPVPSVHSKIKYYLP